MAVQTTASRRPPPVSPNQPRRGVYEDKVYVATVDAFVVALDAATGTVVWETAVEDHRVGYYMTMAPLVVNGKVMVGVSGGELGIRGFVTALDAESGDEVWKTYTIPGPDEIGHDSWPGDSWRTGGVPVWLTGTFDPELNLTYWGTGNAGPWIGDARPGDNLYSNSVIALDADTGALTAHHQYHWNGSWDWDEVAAPLLIDVERGRRTIKSLVHPGRNGYLWLLERSATDISFVDGCTLRAPERVHTPRPDDGTTRVRPRAPTDDGAARLVLPVALGRQELAVGRVQPDDRLPLHPGKREPVFVLGGAGGRVPAGSALYRGGVADLRARRR